MRGYHVVKESAVGSFSTYEDSTHAACVQSLDRWHEEDPDAVDELLAGFDRSWKLDRNVVSDDMQSREVMGDAGFVVAL